MDKKLKVSLISVIAFACVLVAWRSLGSFLGGGFGINYVALLVALTIVLINIVSDSYVRSRIIDLFIITIAFAVLELFVFCATEFGWASAKMLEQMGHYQTLLSVVGLLFLAYAVFRTIYETCSLRFGFVESILGNKKHVKQVKQKQSKEFANGSLEDKPNHKKQEGTFYNTVTTDGEQEGEE